jgi:hypothetical protein
MRGLGLITILLAFVVPFVEAGNYFGHASAAKGSIFLALGMLVSLARREHGNPRETTRRSTAMINRPSAIFVLFLACVAALGIWLVEVNGHSMAGVRPSFACFQELAANHTRLAAINHTVHNHTGPQMNHALMAQADICPWAGVKDTFVGGGRAPISFVHIAIWAAFALSAAVDLLENVAGPVDLLPRGSSDAALTLAFLVEYMAQTAHGQEGFNGHMHGLLSMCTMGCVLSSFGCMITGHGRDLNVWRLFTLMKGTGVLLQGVWLYVIALTIHADTTMATRWIPDYNEATVWRSDAHYHMCATQADVICKAPQAPNGNPQSRAETLTGHGSHVKQMRGMNGRDNTGMGDQRWWNMSEGMTLHMAASVLFLIWTVLTFTFTLFGYAALGYYYRWANNAGFSVVPSDGRGEHTKLDPDVELDGYTN